MTKGQQTITKVTVYNREISTLWDTGASKSVISEKCLQKIHCTDKAQPCTGIRLSSTSASNIISIGILMLHIGLGEHKFKQNFIVCRNLKTINFRPRFYHKFYIGTSLIQMGNFSFTKMENPLFTPEPKVPCQNIHNRISGNSTVHYHGN